MGEDQLQSNITEVAERKATRVVGDELISYASVDDQKKKKEKQINEKTVDVLEILKKGYMDCFKIKNEAELPTYLQTHTQRAKIGFIPLWWTNVFTVLGDPDQDFNYSDDYKKLAENKWFYKYAESSLKISHEFLTALKEDGFISSGDYSKASVGAKTLIIYVIKESILTFGKENKDIYDNNLIEKLNALSVFISRLQANPLLTIYFNQKPNGSDRTLKSSVEYIKGQLARYKDELFTKQKIRPILDTLQEINTTVTNIPKALLEILPLLSGKSNIPSDCMIYVDEPDEDRIPQKALEFLKSNIGQFIINVHQKGRMLQKKLEECNRLILLKSSGIDVSKELLSLMSDINQIINDQFLLSEKEFKDLPEWFFENPLVENKKIRPKVQDVVTRICQAYMTIYVSFPIYKSIITVGQGFGDLGLIERNENIVPYLENIQKKFLELKSILFALGSETGMGIFSNLLSSSTLKVKDDDQNFKKREAWRRKVHHVEIHLMNTLVPWLEDTCNAQQEVISSLNDPAYYAELRAETQKAEVYLKSRVMEAIFKYSPGEFEQIVEEIKENDASSSLLENISIWAYSKHNVEKDLILAGSTLPLTKKDLINYLATLKNYYNHVKEAVEKLKKWSLKDINLDNKLQQFCTILNENDAWANVSINKKSAIDIIKDNLVLEEDEIVVSSELSREIFESYFKAMSDLKIYSKELNKIRQCATDKDYDRVRTLCDDKLLKSGSSLFQECQTLRNENEGLRSENQKLASEYKRVLIQKETLDTKLKQLPNFTKILIESLEQAFASYETFVKSLTGLQKLFHDEKGVKRAEKFINDIKSLYNDGHYIDAIQAIIKFLNNYLQMTQKGILWEWLCINEAKLRQGSFRTYLLEHLSKIAIEENNTGVQPQHRDLILYSDKDWNNSHDKRQDLLKIGVTSLSQELNALSSKECTTRNYVLRSL